MRQDALTGEYFLESQPAKPLDRTLPTDNDYAAAVQTVLTANLAPLADARLPDPPPSTVLSARSALIQHITQAQANQLREIALTPSQVETLRQAARDVNDSVASAVAVMGIYATIKGLPGIPEAVVDANASYDTDNPRYDALGYFACANVIRNSPFAKAFLIKLIP